MKPEDSSVEDFEGWLMASIQPILQKDVLAKIAHFEPGDLPEMIEAIREAELTCRVKGEETRLLVFGGRQETVSQKGERFGTIAYYEDGRLLNMSVWLHRLRMDLEEELERYENAGVSSP